MFQTPCNSVSRVNTPASLVPQVYCTNLIADDGSVEELFDDIFNYIKSHAKSTMETWNIESEAFHSDSEEELSRPVNSSSLSM